MHRLAERLEINLGLPDWVPDHAFHYLCHTELGVSLRALARRAGCHASTVLRQVRRCESLRDDVLIDQALRRLGDCSDPDRSSPSDLSKEPSSMPEVTLPPDDETIEREARRILRRLNESGACLAVAKDMDQAVVVRETDDKIVRTCVVERSVAEAMALKDWISCKTKGKVARYRITSTGRVALRRMIAKDDSQRMGFGEDATPFADQHRQMSTDHKSNPSHYGRPNRRIRYNLAESPLLALSRRRDKDGKPFLVDDLVAAGEQLREDFELAQMGPRVTQNWESFLSAATKPSGAGSIAEGPRAARSRVANALEELGPGLGDVVLRCCCFLEGMEAAERRMGWSARSGKIVLRIALQRLKRYYDTQNGWTPLIG